MGHYGATGIWLKLFLSSSAQRLICWQHSTGIRWFLHHHNWPIPLPNIRHHQLSGVDIRVNFLQRLHMAVSHICPIGFILKVIIHTNILLPQVYCIKFPLSHCISIPFIVCFLVLFKLDPGRHVCALWVLIKWQLPWNDESPVQCTSCSGKQRLLQHPPHSPTSWTTGQETFASIKKMFAKFPDVDKDLSLNTTLIIKPFTLHLQWNLKFSNLISSQMLLIIHNVRKPKLFTSKKSV